MVLINPREMEHIKCCFEYYTAALTHVLLPSSILQPNSCRRSSVQEGRISYFNCINARNLLKSRNVHSFRHSQYTDMCVKVMIIGTVKVHSLLFVSPA